MIIIMFLGLVVPFALITDIFPFMRFGMFAEPIKKEVQTEKFLLYKINSLNQKSLFNPEEIGINPNTFYYLCRNYTYRNESDIFAQKLLSVIPPTIVKIEMYHILSRNNFQESDTISKHIYKRNE